MKPTLVIRPLALAEVSAAQDFIERERPGHGALFQHELDEMIEEIVRQPNRFPFAEGDKEIRQAILDRFSYSIYSRVRPGRIIDVGVYHIRAIPTAGRTAAELTAPRSAPKTPRRG